MSANITACYADLEHFAHVVAALRALEREEQLQRQYPESLRLKLVGLQADVDRLLEKLGITEADA